MKIDAFSEEFIFEDRIKYYTTSPFVLTAFKPFVLERTSNPEEADVMIVESSETLSTVNKNFMISLDSYREGCDSVIPKSNILGFMNLLDSMRNDSSFIGMADPTDVLSVARGTLLSHTKLGIRNSSKDNLITFDFDNDSGSLGVIVYLSQNNTVLLKEISDMVQNLYPEAEVLLLQPTSSSNQNDGYIELFVFRRTDELSRAAL